MPSEGLLSSVTLLTQGGAMTSDEMSTSYIARRCARMSRRVGDGVFVGLEVACKVAVCCGVGATVGLIVAQLAGRR